MQAPRGQSASAALGAAAVQREFGVIEAESRGQTGRHGGLQGFQAEHGVAAVAVEVGMAVPLVPGSVEATDAGAGDPMRQAIGHQPVRLR